MQSRASYDEGATLSILDMRVPDTHLTLYLRHLRLQHKRPKQNFSVSHDLLAERGLPTLPTSVISLQQQGICSSQPIF